MNHFGTAKILFFSLSFLGWAIVAIGGLVALVNYETMQILGVAFSGAIVGVVVVAAAQMGLAQIAVAENTAEIRDILKSQQLVTLADPTGRVEPTFRAQKEHSQVRSQSAPIVGKIGARVKVYKGYEILKSHDGVTVEGRSFANVIKAEQWIINQSRKD
jgi:hypothetical protein